MVARLVILVFSYETQRENLTVGRRHPYFPYLPGRDSLTMARLMPGLIQGLQERARFRFFKKLFFRPGPACGNP